MAHQRACLAPTTPHRVEIGTLGRFIILGVQTGQARADPECQLEGLKPFFKRGYRRLLAKDMASVELLRTGSGGWFGEDAPQAWQTLRGAGYEVQKEARCQHLQPKCPEGFEQPRSWISRVVWL